MSGRGYRGILIGLCCLLAGAGAGAQSSTIAGFGGNTSGALTARPVNELSALSSALPLLPPPPATGRLRARAAVWRQIHTAASGRPTQPVVSSTALAGLPALTASATTPSSVFNFQQTRPHLAFFCRLEINEAKGNIIPAKFRLGGHRHWQDNLLRR